MPLCSKCGRDVHQGEWPFCPHGYGHGTLAGGKPQWDEKDAVVVYRKPDGTYSFPGRNDLPTPNGCERIVARSDHEVAAIERATGTRNEARWFDKGTGRGFDDTFKGRDFE